MKKTDPTTSKEFDKFRELTRKLIQVPKQEVEKKEKEYQNQKKKNKVTSKQILGR